MSRPTRRASSRRSRQVEQGTLGTHVQRTPRTVRSAPAKRNSLALRQGATSRTGEISQVMPQTSSRESSAAYAQRSRQRGFVLHKQRRSWLRIAILALLVVVLVLGAASGVSWLAFKSQAGAKMHLEDAALSEVLSAPEEEGAPYFVLVAGQLSDPSAQPDGPHLIMLARIDELAHTLTLLSIPSNIEMTLSDDNYHTLSFAEVLGGNAELVTQVENLCGVEISQVVKIDSEGFVQIVDALGGITVELEQEADDPDTGSIYLPAGVQTLDGQQALALVRCDNYVTPLETRAHVQAQVFETLLLRVLDNSAFGLAQSIDSLASHVQTTFGFDEVWDLARSFDGGRELVIYEGMVPGQVSIDPDGTFFSINRSALDSMVEAISEGRNPDEAATVSGLTPSLVDVSVKNGAGIVGGAAEVAGILEGVGYQVPETGNAENYVYDETLVVYKDDLMKPTAEDILSVLGNGRTVEAGLFYEFDTDILVIVGKDWVPSS